MTSSTQHVYLFIYNFPQECQNGFPAFNKYRSTMLSRVLVTNHVFTRIFHFAHFLTTYSSEHHSRGSPRGHLRLFKVTGSL